MRYEHLLASAQAHQFPVSLGVVECEGRWELLPGWLPRQREHLVSWHATGYAGRSGCYKGPLVSHGQTVDGFWDELRVRLKRPGVLWLASSDAARVWSLLGLWGRLESGAARWCGTDSRPSPSAGRPRRRGQPGYCVLEDPPFVADFALPSLPGRVRAVDTRNWGLPSPAPGLSASQRGGVLASALVRLVGVLKAEGLGSLQATAGSQAWVALRTRHLPCLVRAHARADALALERSASHGGRCEAFRLGAVDGPVFHLDVSSLYPAIYSDALLPVALRGVCDDLDAHDLRQIGGRDGVIADVEITTTEPAYPYHDPRRGITIWPLGRFRTTLAWPELSDALDAGRVSKVYSAAWYTLAPLLCSWGAHLHALRDAHAGDSELSAWLKTLGVALAGKLGARDRRWEDMPTTAMVSAWSAWWQRTRDGDWERWRCLGDRTQVEREDGFARDAVPAAAAYVTSGGRRRLLEIIRCAGWSQAHYVDTDSIFTTQLGLSRLEQGGLVVPGRWGYLRPVGEYNTLEIHGIKCYTTPLRTVEAGRPLDATDLTAGRGRLWRSFTPGGQIQHQSRPEMERQSVAWRRSKVYKHGLPQPDGRTLPHTLPAK